VPSILFSTGTSTHLERLACLGFDVLSVDWRIPIAEARARAPGVAIQGNLDSTLLLGPAETAVARTRALLRAAGREPGYIFNLGHGVQVGTPPETVKAVVDAVHDFRWDAP
jgi:uroporphyrinogen decarboxylase